MACGAQGSVGWGGLAAAPGAAQGSGGGVTEVCGGWAGAAHGSGMACSDCDCVTPPPAPPLRLRSKRLLSC